MHDTVDKTPDQNITKKYTWQKDHSENRTGTSNRHKPVKIKKDNDIKKYETWK